MMYLHIMKPKSYSVALARQHLAEVLDVRMKGISSASELSDGARWKVDEPPSGAWFSAAHDLSWARDPFDRLIVAHALARGYRLATADAHILRHLGARDVLAL